MTDRGEPPARPGRPARPPAAVSAGARSSTRALRRADLAALLVGVATIGYTVFALLQPVVSHDTTEDAAQSRPTTAPPAIVATGPATDAGHSETGHSEARHSEEAVTTNRSGSGRGGRTADVPPDHDSTAPARADHGRDAAGDGPGAGQASAHSEQASHPEQAGHSEQAGHDGEASAPSKAAGGDRSATTAPSRSAPAASARQALPAVSVPCSRPSLIPTRVTFVNTTSEALQLQYSTLRCGRLSFGSVPPGGRTTVSTWVSNAWAFVDPRTGQAIAAHVVSPGDRVVNMP